MTGTGTGITPAHERRGSSSPTTARRVLTEIGFVAAGFACYLAVRWYTLDSTDEAIRHTDAVLRLERLLGLDQEHAIQDATLSVPGLGSFFTTVYVWGYFPVLAVLVVWLFLRHRESYVTMRNALLASGAAGLLVYAFYPTAPPWIGGGHGFTDTVAGDSFVDVARPPGITNHLGAVPSFHVAWVILAGVAVFRFTTSHTVRVLCVLYPALMAYAVISTGNHWILDIPAGAALAAFGLAVATLMSSRPPHEPVPRRPRVGTTRDAGKRHTPPALS